MNYRVKNIIKELKTSLGNNFVDELENNPPKHRTDETHSIKDKDVIKTMKITRHPLIYIRSEIEDLYLPFDRGLCMQYIEDFMEKHNLSYGRCSDTYLSLLWLAMQYVVYPYDEYINNSPVVKEYLEYYYEKQKRKLSAQ